MSCPDMISDFETEIQCHTGDREKEITQIKSARGCIISRTSKYIRLTEVTLYQRMINGSLTAI